MEIICPECDFRRTVPDEKVPPTAEMATCPKCKAKFRFRTLDQAGDVPPPIPPAPGPQQTPEPPPGPAAPPLPYEDEPPQPMAGSDTSSRQERGDVFSGLDAMGDGERRNRQEQGYQAYQAAGAYDDEEEELEEVPWERLDDYGFFPGLFGTVKRAMLQPQDFFSRMPLGRGLMRPLAFYVLLSTLAAVVQFLFQGLGLGLLGSMQGPETEMFGPTEIMGMGAASVFVLLLYPIVFTVGLYITAGVYHLFLKLFQAGEAGFEGTFRALAYGSAPTVLSVVPLLGWMVGSVWTLVLTIIGLKTVHRTSYARVLAAIGALLFTFVMLIGILVYLVHGLASSLS